MRGVCMQEMILGKETGEQQSVPVLVRRFLQQVADFLGARTLVPNIAERSTAGAQSVPKLPRLHRHVRPVIPLMHGEMLEGCPHPTLRRLSSSESHPGQLVAKVLG